MAARRPFWKWRRWKSMGFCLWPPSTCIWSLKLKFQRKLDLYSGNHVVYRQTDRRTDGRTRWIQYTPPPTSLGGGIMTNCCDEISDPTPIHVASRIARIMIRSKQDRSWNPIGSRSSELMRNYWSDHFSQWSDRFWNRAQIQIWLWFMSP